MQQNKFPEQSEFVHIMETDELKFGKFQKGFWIDF